MCELENWIDRFNTVLAIQKHEQIEYIQIRFDNRDLKEIIYLLGELKAFRDNQAENESYHSGGIKNV